MWIASGPMARYVFSEFCAARKCEKAAFVFYGVDPCILQEPVGLHPCPLGPVILPFGGTFFDRPVWARWHGTRPR